MRYRFLCLWQIEKILAHLVYVSIRVLAQQLPKSKISGAAFVHTILFM